MGKVLRRNTSFDGKVKVGEPAPSWTQNLTTSSTTDGRRLEPIWIRQKDAKMNEIIDCGLSLHNKVMNQSSQRFQQKSKEQLTEARKTKFKVGAKEKLSDPDALYLRRESKTKSVSSLCKELNISRKTADNCIKGITYKHLDCVEKPQR